MSGLSEHATSLRLTRACLLDQMHAIDVRARKIGCEPEQLLTADGQFMQTPVLVALAHVEVALLQIELAPRDPMMMPLDPDGLIDGKSDRDAAVVCVASTLREEQAGITEPRRLQLAREIVSDLHLRGHLQ